MTCFGHTLYRYNQYTASSWPGEAGPSCELYQKGQIVCSLKKFGIELKCPLIFIDLCLTEMMY